MKVSKFSNAVKGIIPYGKASAWSLFFKIARAIWFTDSRAPTIELGKVMIPDLVVCGQISKSGVVEVF